MTKRTPSFRLLTATTLLAASCMLPGAQASVINFDAVPTGDCSLDGPAIVDGFGISNAGVNEAAKCDWIAPTAHSGKNYLLSANDLPATLSKLNGLFSLNSLFVYRDDNESALTVRFQGLTVPNGNVFSLDVELVGGWQEVVFTGWKELTSFNFESINPAEANVLIDDVNITVPEPGSLALLGLGLAGLLARRRLKR